MRKLIGIKELAKQIDIPVGTIYVWTSMKVIPYYKVGRLVKFDEAEIEKWIEERKHPVSKFADEYWGK